MTFLFKTLAMLCISVGLTFIPIIIGGSVVGGVPHGAAWAETREEKKVQSIVKRADKLGEKIAEHESGEKKFTDRNIASLTKQIDRLADQLSEFDGIAGQEEALQSLAGLTDRVNGLQEQLAAALEATGGLTQREFDKQTKDVQRLIQQAERIVSDGDGINWEVTKDDRRAQKLEKAFAKLEPKAAEIVELVPGYAEMIARVDAARQVTLAVREQTDAFLAARGDAKDRLIGFFESGKSVEDSNFVHNLSSWSYEVQRKMDRVDGGELIFWNGMQETELYKSWAAELEANEARIATLKTDYAGVTGPMLTEVSNELVDRLGSDARVIGGLDTLVRGQLQTIEHAFDAVAALRDNGVERTRARIAEADAEMVRLEAQLEYNELRLGNSITAPMIYGEALLVVLDGYTSDVAEIKATVATDMAAAKTRLAATTQRVYDRIVETNEVPSHRYEGSDADVLIAKGKEIFADVFKDEKTAVGAFIPDADWYRDIGERVVGNEVKKYDESRLFVTVFAVEPNDYLSKWTLYVTKDHLKEDRISYHVAERSYDDPISPYRVYPAASITGLR